MLVFGYPVYFSNAPKIVQDFIRDNGSAFEGKRIFIIATMSIFSGDGAGGAARLLSAHGAEILGGLHLKMPDNVGDEPMLKKPLHKKHEMFRRAEEKIALAAKRLHGREPFRDGLSPLHHVAGFLSQRMWFFYKTSSYRRGPKIALEKCSGCGRCVRLCPMKNLSISSGKAHSDMQCTLCYRCFSHCPEKALTILGRTVHEQYLFEKYSPEK